MVLVDRHGLRERILRFLDQFPVVLLLGPRQCGKTTLAREIAQLQNATYFDLEDPQCPLQQESASLMLRDSTGLVVIDEFQRMPRLFELLRVLADRRPLPARFLILGSVSPDLVKGASETLAGRVAYVPMGGFDLQEAGAAQWRTLWNRGAFPDSFLARDDDQSFEWRQNFIQSFLERDMPQLDIRAPAATLRRFWIMLAHLHGQTLNVSELARSMDVTHLMVRRYLDTLTGAFMIRQLQPWYENVGKRLVKAPKIYLRDTGLLHALLGLRNAEQAMANPRLGFSWEGFALEEVIRRLNADRDAFFYKAHGGTEVDLFLLREGKRLGFECKWQDAPRATKSMHTALEDLKLDKLFVVYPGNHRYPLETRIEALPLPQIAPNTINE
ncbi:MAG: ATP-binding protein [Candidatus Hydrogenedentes bacterium]|nr:ATP-binding protein [Candidatus Hydrogenedentota bacterium]